MDQNTNKRKSFEKFRRDDFESKMDEDCESNFIENFGGDDFEQKMDKDRRIHRSPQFDVNFFDIFFERLRKAHLHVSSDRLTSDSDAWCEVQFEDHCGA